VSANIATLSAVSIGPSKWPDNRHEVDNKIYVFSNDKNEQATTRKYSLFDSIPTAAIGLTLSDDNVG